MAEKKLLVDERRRLAEEAALMRESVSGSETSSPNFSRLPVPQRRRGLARRTESRVGDRGGVTGARGITARRL